ncbi:lipocalin family protein [Trichlorobacter ammonificans]|uniref:Outer membrane lipoprotein Blc n=1 Tax=Trichlorobacter ammonificans TaxID=2916410 RepID=A0ABM9DBE2_9BACT|nr:lipocalin family protein [Trichlorobacter ammonificans]CAH2031714.1 Outer membrane lipoprotein Blc [Trichlorobacter ammonificans]
MRASSRIITVVALLALVWAAAAGTGSAASGAPPLPTVPKVDLPRYMGLWHEIARLDHSFQRGCGKSSATYTLLPDGEVEVLNRCVDLADGHLREAKGRAWSVDPVGNARFKVSFFWPFRGDYWVIDLGREYEYAVVGSPNRRYLWILARQPSLDEPVYRDIVEKLRRQGFPVEQLTRK